MPPKPIATIIDVARTAKVSVSTVSRILNEKPDVAEETRERVLSVIKELGYVPHSQAKRLKAGESRTIALLDPVNVSGEQKIDQLHLDFMIGAASAAGQENYFFNVLAAEITEARLIDMYRSVQVDGAILMEIFLDDWRVDLLHRNGFPFVMIGRRADNAGLSFVELDFEATALAAFEHLAGLGHRRIAYLGFPEELRLRGYGPAVRGWQGHKAALGKFGLPDIACEIAYNAEEMGEATEALLDRHPDLTGIVALTDAPLAGVLAALRARGRDVPRDFSVIGLAIDRIAELMTPRLTAVRFPSYEMGQRAASMLIRALRGEAEGEEQVLLQPELVVRASTGPAPA